MLEADGIGLYKQTMEKAGMNKEERLRKLIALRGNTKHAGEREAASAAIERLIGRGDVVLDTKKVCFFKFGNAMEKRLLFQVAASVTGKSAKRSWVNPAKKKQVGIELSESEWAEIDLLYDYYKRMLKKHLEASFVAFVLSNQLVGEAKSKSRGEMTKEEKEEFKRIVSMMDGAKYARPAKQLEG